MENNKTQKLRFFGINRIIPYMKPYRISVVIMILLGIVSSIGDSIYPLFNRYAINNFIGLKTLDGLTPFIIMYIAVLLIQVFSNVVSSYLIGKVELDIGRDMKNAVFNHLQELSFSYYNTHNVGYIHARLMSDTDAIATAFTWRLMDIVWYGSYIILVFVVMLIINIRLAIILLLLIPLAALFVSLFQNRLLGLNRKVRELNSEISADFNEGITGAKQVRALSVEKRIIGDFQEDTGKMHRMSVHTARWSSLFTSTVTAMSSVALALVLWYGGKLTLETAMEIGTLSVFMTYALDIMEPLQYIIESISAFMNLQVNIERVTDLLATEPNVADAKEVTQKYGDTFEPKYENWEKLSGSIEFKDVSFQYPDGDELVLSHFNLVVPKGTNVAIVGETGAGKSTIVNLVCRFFEPTEGVILIDGRDARERSQLWLHSNIGYVLQTPHLFSGTVRENLLYGKPDASDEEIWNALRLVSAEDIVKRMPDMLDSEVGEGGDFLSVGEKQLLSFARAIISDPAILILDEATASVDTLTEHKLQEAVGSVTSGRTSFVIAHRLSTIVSSDIILVIDNGTVAEAGTHEELLSKKGIYYRLYNKQYEDNALKKIL